MALVELLLSVHFRFVVFIRFQPMAQAALLRSCVGYLRFHQLSFHLASTILLVPTFFFLFPNGYELRADNQ